MVDLKSLTPSELEEFARESGQPSYRGRQLLKWIYGKGTTQFREMTNLPLDFRQHLERSARIVNSSIDREFVSRDGTRKYAISLESGRIVESVLIPDFDEEQKAKRLTACISSQVGCAMGCTFCATGLLGFQQNLTPGEIFDQVQLVSEQSRLAYGRGLTNIVFMGMGEPLLNYKSLVGGIELISHPDALAMSPRRITISTVGLAKQIRKLADNDLGCGLAVSLHAPTDQQRSVIMPVNRAAQTDLGALRGALETYYAHTKRPVTYEYCLFGGFNDRNEDAENLARVSRWIPSKINLLSYNPVEGLPFKRVSEDQLDRFAQILADARVRVTVRKSRGQDIDAACGQLAGRMR